MGADGETHQGCFDLSYLTMMPNMTVMAPKIEMGTSEDAGICSTSWRTVCDPLSERQCLSGA